MNTVHDNTLFCAPACIAQTIILKNMKGDMFSGVLSDLAHVDHELAGAPNLRTCDCWGGGGGGPDRRLGCAGHAPQEARAQEHKKTGKYIDFIV